MDKKLIQYEKRGKRSLIIFVLSGILCYSATLLGVPNPWPLVMFVAINVVANIKI